MVLLARVWLRLSLATGCDALGDTVVRHEIIATMQEGAAPSKQASSAGQKSDLDDPKSQSNQAPKTKAGESIAGPAPHKMAEKEGVDLAKVVGSGKKKD